MLSGGERQRVAIARAIVKNPDIIIADEPTGNLDSKNTIEIMNIIKSISKDKLVILVTHEKDIAYFYASRVIEILDGKIISDKDNTHDDSLDYRIENKIYLKDIKNHETIKSNNLNVDYYSEDTDKLNVRIVVKNGNIFIETDSKDKLEIVDESSSLELIDDSYKKITKESYEKYKFDFNEIINKDIKLKYTSIYNPISLLKSGFYRVKSYPIFKKILLIGFFIASMFIIYSISNIGGILNIKEENFVTHNKNYLSIPTNKIDKDRYLEYEKLEDIYYLLPGDSDVMFNIKFNFYYQTNYASDNLHGSLSSTNMITKKDLIYGVMPTNDYEIVVDKLAITNMFQSYVAKQAGILNVEDILDLYAEINNMPKFKIVGITDLKSPSIYVNESMFTNILANTNDSNNDYFWSFTEKENKVIDYTLIDDLVLKKGKLPENKYEVIVNYNDRYEYALNKEINIKINDTKLKVVGYYESSINKMLANIDTVKLELLENSSNIIVYPKDKDKVVDYFMNNKIKIEDIYTKDRNNYMEDRKDSIVSALVVAGITLSISLLEIYLMIRSSFLSRIKEIGILRAIGIKKSDIYKMFLAEILAITLTASLLGIITMGYALSGIIKLPLLGDNYMFNPLIVLISIIVVFIFNIAIGLLPVFKTIRKMPADILSRIDID